MKKRRNKKIEFTEYKRSSRGGRKHVKEGLLTTFDRLEYIAVNNSSREEMFRICDIILGGRAVLANFDKIDDDDANEMLLFISGVVYATEGQTFKISSRLFLFGRKEEYEDGSLLQYVEDTM